MNRTLKLSILLALTLSSTQALALGLGQIRVKSALNKPLVAEIPLQTDYPGEASDLQVSLASPDQFARAGLDRLSLTVQLKFKVTTNAAGQKVIRVTSDEPVRETFLDFLVKVDWPRGQLLREYTVLLDPPGSEATARLQGAVTPSAAAPPKPAPEPAPKPAKTAAPVKPAPVAKAAPEMKTAAKPVQSKPTPKPAQKKVKPAARPPAASAQVQNGNYGRVRHGQTLWGIAHNQHPGGVSVNQMMLALKSANPDAFYKDNINALKSGAVLRIPTRDELLAQTAAAATAEVLRQDRSWSAMVPHRTTMVASAGPGGASRPGKPASSSRAGTASNRSGDELKLVPPSNGGESTGARAGVAGGSNKVAVEQLHQEVSRAKEALSSAQQQTADLQAHLKSLKDIQSKNNRLLDLKNAEITELQNKLAAADKKPSAAGSALAPAVNGSVPASGSSAAIAMAAAASGAAPAKASTAAAGSVATTPKAVATSPKPVAKPSQPKPVPRPAPVQPWYGPLWVKLVAALGVIVLLLLLLRSKRKAGSSKPSLNQRSIADQFGDSSFGPAADDDGDEEQDELLRELAENPEDLGLHLELVSFYYARRDVERFESAAEAMRTHISDPQQQEWQDVIMMGEELSPDYPLFAADEGAYSPEIPDEDDETHPLPDEGSTATPGSADSDWHDARDEADPEDAIGTSEHYDFRVGDADMPAPGMSSEEDPDALPPLDGETSSSELGDFTLPGDDVTSMSLDTDDDVSPASGADEVSDADTDTEVKPENDAEGEAEDDVEPVAASGMGGDAVDTKIDLARAYMDMGDPEGARAMLEEAMHEGSQSQRDMAQKMLDELD